MFRKFESNDSTTGIRTIADYFFLVSIFLTHARQFERFVSYSRMYYRDITVYRNKIVNRFSAYEFKKKKKQLEPHMSAHRKHLLRATNGGEGGGGD